MQDTWHKDQLLFDEDQLQSLSSMLVGTSYCESDAFLFVYLLTEILQTRKVAVYVAPRIDWLVGHRARYDRRVC